MDGQAETGRYLEHDGVLPLRRVAALHVAEGRVGLDDALVAQVLQQENARDVIQ